MKAVYSKQQLKKMLPLMILLFCVMQPLLDVLGYWQQQLEIPNGVTMFVRMLLLALMLLLGFVLSDRKWVYLCGGGVVLLYLIGHVLSCRAMGYLDPLEDLTEQMRIFLMPATALCFITFLKQNSRSYKAMLIGLMVNLGVILLVELLATLTGTDPHTYSNKNIGVLGWFIWANSQSAILSILCPIAIYFALERFEGRLLPLVGTCLLSFGLLFFCGTRLAYLSLAAAGVGMALCLLLMGKARRRQAVAVLCCALVFLALIPVSPMVKNQKTLDQNVQTKQDRIYAAVAPYGVTEEQTETDDPQALAAAYHFYLQALVDRFGLERVARQYHNSLKVGEIFDRRTMLLSGCRLLMEDAPHSARFFGLELGLMRQKTELYDFAKDQWHPGTETFDPENDFHGVYYLCGLVGLGLIVCFLLLFALRALIALGRAPKDVFTPGFCAFACAFAIALCYAWATVSVLRRNNASVYLGLTLAGLWYHSGKDGKTYAP